MALYDRFFRNEEIEEKLNPIQSYLGVGTQTSREFTDKYETYYENLEVVNRAVNMVVDDAAEIPSVVDRVSVPGVIKEFKLSNYFKGVAIRPGKPIMFAQFKNKDKSFFGLPGNPISSAACFKFFVYPYLRSILNMKNEKPFKARLKNNYKKKKNFTRFLKGKVTISNKGILEIEVLKGQESFRIKSFTKANSWCLFKSGKSTFKKGDLIECFNLLGGQ